MNCEAYLVEYDKAKPLWFYPRNIDASVIEEMCVEVKTDDTLLIRRSGDMIYYLYLRKCVGLNEEYVGLAVGVNLVVIDNIAALHDFFSHEFRTIIRDYGIANYDSETAEYSSVRGTPADGRYNIGGAMRRLQDAFNARFADENTLPGAINYASHPGKEFLRIKEDRSVVRFHTKESNYASRTVRQTIEQGDTVIVTSELTTEQQLARFQKRLNNQYETLNAKDKQITELRQENVRLRNKLCEIERTASASSPKEVVRKTPVSEKIALWFLGFMFSVILSIGLVTLLDMLSYYPGIYSLIVFFILFLMGLFLGKKVNKSTFVSGVICAFFMTYIAVFFWVNYILYETYLNMFYITCSWAITSVGSMIGYISTKLRKQTR